MLASLKRYFEARLAPGPDAGAETRRLQVATAALLVEVMRLDGVADDERRAVLSAVRGKFSLSDEDAATIVALAEDEARESVGFYQFTSLVNRRFSAAEKERIVELMWQVAYADATLSAHEQHVIRKVADLLYVPHSAYIAAKLRAKGAA